MRKLVEVTLSDGHTMWANVEYPDGMSGAPGGVSDVGLRTEPTRIRGFDEVLDWVGTNLAAAWRRAGPDRVTAEFGIELAVGHGGLVAALGGAGATATVKVTMSWGGDDSGPPVAAAPTGEPE